MIKVEINTEGETTDSVGKKLIQLKKGLKNIGLKVYKIEIEEE